MRFLDPLPIYTMYQSDVVLLIEIVRESGSNSPIDFSYVLTSSSQGYGGKIEELEEALLQLQTLLSMRHVTPFREDVQVHL